MKPVCLVIMDLNVTDCVRHFVSTDSVMPQLECVMAVWQVIMGTTVTCRAVTVTYVIKLMDLVEENAIMVGMDKTVSRYVLLIVCRESVTN